MSHSDSPSRVVSWIRRTYPVLGTIDPFALLEIEPIDSDAEITHALERIATSRHPDLFRHHLGRVELAQLEAVYAACVAACHRLLDSEERRRLGARPRRMPRGTSSPTRLAPVMPMNAPREPEVPARLSPRAMHHARQAQAALAFGDVASAILYLKMAVAAEPTAPQLREMLAEAQRRLHR